MDLHVKKVNYKTSNDPIDEELTRRYFQQDGAPVHTACTTSNYLEEFYEDRLISSKVWPENWLDFLIV